MKLGRLIGIARLTILAIMIGVVVVGVARAQTAPPITIADRAAFYDKLAREKSTTIIEESIRDALTAKPDASPKYVIEALFERYFELEGPAAVRFAGQKTNAPIDVVRLMYKRLARTNANAALAELSLIDDAPLAQAAAAAIVETLPKDLATIDLVAAALHVGNVDQFRVYALNYVTSIPPRDALAAVLRLHNVEHRDAVAAAIVARWAQSAPREAVQEIDRVQDPTLRSALRRSALQNWRDTSSLATYLIGLGTADRRAVLGDGALLVRLAETDPERAAMLAQSLPAGPERRAALQQVAAGYVQKDGIAAFKWAQTMSPPQPEVVQAVMSALSARDPLRVFDLAGSLTEPARMQAYYSAIAGMGAGFAREQPRFEQLAPRIAALPDSQYKAGLLSSLLASWARTPDNAKSALDWAMANSASLPAQSFQGSRCARPVRRQPSIARHLRRRRRKSRSTDRDHV